ncbi:aminotransferase class III-fold pyridoxal phosphate-dependent enzyme (plasmid) [Haloferax mediterranei ATCC 33500]|uniref:Aminotransferase class III n=1 Tax=Haloferax mediterranei (strain ATCC 33500 / DSM 1411 / JCM 8866 / NBRC 14739 / NCIMB 2177 / R-4) TaxID=523841 RepID=I3R9H2_HALMT|nr:diaminobutyrate--2-oxoglutarate transaminase [Haloferax mediterranei]AFK20882.1 diaminobutyrate--pyruvate aminotransferase (siderophore biosynthesis protein) [Haloferax mediterranei ATCC 33500]AHZ24249.1 aminotransferase class III [Haloferax mediterranei ATCC 33500]EMA05328.1 diaminobutyrate--pyruvate aminotransferase [Haloferax mediterranei ATCC 33500]MDX5989870.1 diaminobutyrate--2-oxoglutarate transaminase [Haloferax mediterranei ATCC 33500]QCQ77311.1 aminotransferase class III-fold pyri
MTNNETLLRQQAARESNARSYPRNLPHAVKEAKGVTVIDMDGNEYYDCLAGAGTLALGHNHPKVVEAMETVLAEDRPLHTLDITTPVKERFVDTLFGTLPDEFSDNARIQFCSPAGTDAIEAAIKLVKTATGNRSILGFQGGYHGMTNGALSLMGDTDPKADVPGLMPNVHHLPYPYEYRCPFGVGGEQCHELASRYVENTLDDPESGITDPAGMVVELVQGEGGAIPASDEWTREIRRMTRERDIPLIVDEVQTGLGRTGELYAFEHADIVPDVITLSKAVGGSLPLSVVVYDESLDEWEPGAHAGTFRGNQLAMAAGIATIEQVVENNLDEHAERVGERLRGHLESTASEHDAVGDVRGRGLMLGVEMVDPSGEPDGCGHFPAHSDLADAVRAACFDRGLIVELGGRHSSVVRFLPPLIVSESDVDDIGRIFDEAVEAALETVGRGTSQEVLA